MQFGVELLNPPALVVTYRLLMNDRAASNRLYLALPLRQADIDAPGSDVNWLVKSWARPSGIQRELLSCRRTPMEASFNLFLHAHPTLIAD